MGLDSPSGREDSTEHFTTTDLSTWQCCLHFSIDGKYLATGSNRHAHIFDVATQQKVCTLKHGLENQLGDNYVRGVRFSPDGQYLATASEDKTINIWDIASKRIRATYVAHQSEVYALDYSSDGRILASASGDATVCIWNCNSAESKVFRDPDNSDAQSGYTCVAISPNCRWVSAGSIDGTVRIWDIMNGQLVLSLCGHQDSVYSLTYLDHGNALVSASLDKTLNHWDISWLNTASIVDPSLLGSIPCVKTLTGHEDYVLNSAKSKDDRWIVSSSRDGSIRVWDMNRDNGVTHCTLKDAHSTSLICVALSNKGGILATGGSDGQLKMSCIKSFVTVFCRTLMLHRDRELQNIFPLDPLIPSIHLPGRLMQGSELS